MLNIEQAVRNVEAVYQALTGRPIEAGRAEAQAAWAPPVDVIELAHEVCCSIDLPGTLREQVSVAVVGDYLVVSGRRLPAIPQGAALRLAERPAGAFQRAIALPPRARRDGIVAALREGVLSVTIPTDGNGGGESAPIDVK